MPRARQRAIETDIACRDSKRCGMADFHADFEVFEIVSRIRFRHAALKGAAVFSVKPSRDATGLEQTETHREEIGHDERHGGSARREYRPKLRGQNNNN